MRVDAVLLRDNRGLGPDDRPDRLAGGLDIPQLDTEDHVIDDADVGRIVSRVRTADNYLAAVALDLEAVRLHRREMRAARDKDDVDSGVGERSAVDAADPAGADHRDAHALPRFPLTRHLLCAAPFAKTSGRHHGPDGKLTRTRTHPRHRAETRRATDSGATTMDKEFAPVHSITSSLAISETKVPWCLSPRQPDRRFRCFGTRRDVFRMDPHRRWAAA